MASPCTDLPVGARDKKKADDKPTVVQQLLLDLIMAGWAAEDPTYAWDVEDTVELARRAVILVPHDMLIRHLCANSQRCALDAILTERITAFTNDEITGGRRVRQKLPRIRHKKRKKRR